MAGKSSARDGSGEHVLRQRMHILDRASRSLIAGEPSRSGKAHEVPENHAEELRSLPSPPTSFAYDYMEEEDEDDYEDEGSEHHHQHGSGEEGGYTHRPTSNEAAETRADAEREHDDDDSSRPWYRPSLPVVLALVPAVGNWFTGGDHIKDVLVFLLLIFYLHQVIEVPWRLYRSARPRRSPSPHTSTAPSLIAAQANTELRMLEFLLLIVCVAVPVAGVYILRSFSIRIKTEDESGPTQPISWFSTTLFALATALRPLSELVSRITKRTSTLHARVHAHTAPAGPDPALALELSDLKAQVARLETVIMRMSQRDAELYAFVEDALQPLEKNVRRMERRVGKLRAAQQQRKDTNGAAGATPKTIFVSAPTHNARPFSLAWLFSSPLPSNQPSLCRPRR
ncbi:unnamed protein product [Mycena citricolor]|uniref:Uncharacterized protein n=1 Tax=Mycena citricolor TaxID=2018698 RepID=A0AAD2H7L8_9AGAR|nr:unnamed protein product [Mycena citricolor]